MAGSGKKIGRPPIYSKALADRICQRLAEGESLRNICRDPDMPGRAVVHRWLADPNKTEFRDRYAQACELRAELMFEEILDIADDGSADYKISEDGEEFRLDQEHVQRSKLRIDARKWVLARMAPKKYGDKVDHQHSGQIAILDKDDRKL